MQLNIWYRAYSLKNSAMIDCSHQPEWSIYLSEDTGCCFYSSASSFLEGYYQNENEEVVIVTQVEVGSLPSMQKEFCLIQYNGSTMSVNEDMAGIDEEFDIPLTPIKQVWVELQGDSLRDDISALLQDYNNL